MTQSESQPLAAGPSFVQAPLVGRDAEMALLKRAADQSRARREARVITLLGAGGIGKTRIVNDFVLELRGSSDKSLRVYRGSARSLGLSYGVFARLLRTRFGIVEGMDVDAAKAQLRSQVAQVLEDRKVGDVCYFLGQLMDLPFLESPLTRAVADDAMQAKLLRRSIVKTFIENDAAQSAACLVFDDLHFADDDSIELLRYLIENLEGPILLLCLARPELVSRHEDWADFGRGRHERLEIGPLHEDQATQVMRALLAPCDGGPPQALISAGVGLATGNPGLLEQMVRIFHDSGVLEEHVGPSREPSWRVHMERLAAVHLPLTVEDAVAARISALSPGDRRLLERAAAMGSVFWLGGLVTLARMDHEAPEHWTSQDSTDVQELVARLDDLVQRDYVLRLPDSAFAGDTEYVFKHNLEREKLASLTSASAARRYHQTIADWLAQQDSVRSQEEYSAMSARHLERAGSTTRAGLTYIESGDLARQSYAAKKAHEYYVKGLALLGDSDARRRIDALHNHGDVLLLLGKTDEALAAFREMLAIAWRLQLKGKGGAAHNRIGRVHRDTGSLLAARKHFDTSLELFQTVNDERGVAACHDDIGKLLWVRGEYDDALKQMKMALEMRKKIGDRRSIALSLNNIGLVWMDHGRAANAAEALEAALNIRREVADPLGIVQTLGNLGRLAQDQNDHRRALELFREAYDGAREIGERNRIAVVLTNMGESHYKLGDTAQAIRILTDAEELCDELGDRLHLAEAKRGLAKAYLLQGELKKAREAIKHAVDLFGQVRSKAHLAVALRTLGEVTAAGAWGEGHEGKAVDYFMRSVALSKEIGNELEEAKSYKAFSTYVTSSPHYRGNADIQREAQKLETMANEIFSRHRIGKPAAAGQG